MNFYKYILKQIHFLKYNLLIQPINEYIEFLKQKYLRYTFLISGVLFVVVFSGCVTQKSLPGAVFANNYSALTDDELNAIPSDTKSLSKQESVNIALSNNPEFKIVQNKAEIAQTNYYKALGGLSPTLSAASVVGNGGSSTGISSNSRVFEGGASVMNILAAKAKADQSEWDVKNNRRKLVQNVTVQDNQLNRISSDIEIQIADEKFQTKMYERTLKKYKQGKASKADVLNFEINALKAKDAIITSESNYKKNSYKLAATMGITTAELPGSITATETSISDLTYDESVYGINYYLDAAIANRPDLKAQRDALKAAAYSMYAAWGSLLPSLDIGLSRGLYSVIKWNPMEGGSRVFNIRSQEISYDAQQEALLKKWIDVVREVRTEHDKLSSSIHRLKILDQTVKEAIQRRNMVVKQYNSGNADIASLNQAQTELVQTQESCKKANLDVLNAKVGLNAACGIHQY